MNLPEALKELTIPEQRKRHMSVFTHQIGVMVLDILVFLLTLFIGSLLFHIRFTQVGAIIAVAGGILTWVWLLTGGRVDDK
jgi:hypothetical protein